MTSLLLMLYKLTLILTRKDRINPLIISMPSNLLLFKTWVSVLASVLPRGDAVFSSAEVRI